MLKFVIAFYIPAADVLKLKKFYKSLGKLIMCNINLNNYFFRPNIINRHIIIGKPLKEYHRKPIRQD